MTDAAYGTSAFAKGGSSTSPSATKPASLADGDYVVWICAQEQTSYTVTPPTGFTLIKAGGFGSYPIAMYGKAITNAAGEPASYTGTLSTAGYWYCGAIRVTGTTLGPDTNKNGTLNGDASGNYATASLTTTTTGGLIIICQLELSAGMGTWTPDAALTEIDDRAGSLLCTFQTTYKVAATATSYGGYTNVSSTTPPGSNYGTYCEISIAQGKGSTPVTGTIGSTFPKMTAAIQTKQKHKGTVTASFPKMTAALAAKQKHVATIGAAFIHMGAVVQVKQKHVATIASSFTKMAAALAAKAVTGGPLAASFPKMTAALSVKQKHVATVAASFIHMGAALSAFEHPRGAIAASFKALRLGNRVANPSLDTDITGWDSNGAGLTVAWTGANFYSGTGALRATYATAAVARAARYGNYSPPPPRLPAVPGETYIVSYMHQLQSGTPGPMTTLILWLDSGFSFVSASTSSTFTPAGSWAEATFSAVAPATAAFALVYCCNTDGSARTCVIDIDDLSYGARSLWQKYPAALSSSFGRMTAALAVKQKYPTTIGASFPRLGAVLAASQKYPTAIGASFPRMTAAVAVGQKHIAAVAGSLPRMTAALVAKSAFIGAIGASFPSMTAALAAHEHPRVAIAASFGRMTAVIATITYIVRNGRRPPAGGALYQMRPPTGGGDGAYRRPPAGGSTNQHRPPPGGTG